jgi:hypothetical protein
MQVAKNIEFDCLDLDSIQQALYAIEKEKEKRLKQGEQIVTALLRIAKLSIENSLTDVEYDGTNDAKSYYKQTGNRGEVGINGQSVLFIEFGTGIKYTAESHPYANETGMFPGSFPGKGQWNNEEGWIYIGEPGTNGEIIEQKENGTAVRTYGNKPNNIVYRAFIEVRRYLPKVVDGVFR